MHRSILIKQYQNPLKINLYKNGATMDGHKGNPHGRRYIEEIYIKN